MKTDSIYPLLIAVLIGGCAYMDKPHADGMPTDIPEQMLFEPPLHNYGCDPIIDPEIVQDERPSAAQIKKRVVHEIREPSFITALVSGIIAYIGFMSIRRLTRRNMGKK